MTRQHIRIARDIVERGAQSVDITDRHGVRKPFFLVISLKHLKVCIKRGNRYTSAIDGCPCRITHRHRIINQSRRRRNSFLGTAAEDINLKIIHAHILAEHAGDGIHHREYPVFFQKRTKRRDVI